MATTLASAAPPSAGPITLDDFDVARRETGKSVLYICSVYPRARKTELPYMCRLPDGAIGFMSTYALPAVPRGEHAVLPVYTTMQLRAAEDLTQDGERFMGQQPRPALASLIARSLLQRWRDNAVGASSDACPGIGLIEGSAPTREELAELNAKQTRYFQGRVDYGNLLYRTRDARNQNAYALRDGSIYRLAAAWLQADVEWAKDYSGADTKRCIRCNELISATASGCKHCGVEVADYAIAQGWTHEELLASDPYIANQPVTKRKFAEAAKEPRVTVAAQPVSEEEAKASKPVRPPVAKGS